MYALASYNQIYVKATAHQNITVWSIHIWICLSDILYFVTILFELSLAREGNRERNRGRKRAEGKCMAIALNSSFDSVVTYKRIINNIERKRWESNYVPFNRTVFGNTLSHLVKVKAIISSKLQVIRVNADNNIEANSFRLIYTGSITCTHIQAINNTE